MKSVFAILTCLAVVLGPARAQTTQPIVAIHDSELTRAFLTQAASNGTPTGAGTTGKQWWPTDWNYFVMPEALQEMFRSDGTAFTVLGDSNITAGLLLRTACPRYPIFISLAAEAIRDDEIAPLTNYVAAGGFLFIGSSSFTRNTNGTSRGNFAIASAMGVNMVSNSLANWGLANYLTTQTNNRIVNDIPPGRTSGACRSPPRKSRGARTRTIRPRRPRNCRTMSGRCRRPAPPCSPWGIIILTSSLSSTARAVSSMTPPFSL